MVSNRLYRGIALRAGALFLALACLAWLFANTRWYVTISLLALVAITEFWALIRFATAHDRDIARFLSAIAHGDLTQNFSRQSGVSSELGGAMDAVLQRLRHGRKERDLQARYVQTLLAHVPVGLISIDVEGRVDLLNLAARRLLGEIRHIEDLAKLGADLLRAVAELVPGATAVVRVEGLSRTPQLKLAASAFVAGGEKRRVISLQDIEGELDAQELAAWQSVMQVISHEVMNSLTPISSLSETALGLVRGTAAVVAADGEAAAQLGDAAVALETVTRRSEGLLHFVQDHRRVTRRLTVNPVPLSVRGLFGRLQRLFATEMAGRNLSFAVSVEPETLEVIADIDLLEQALINLIRNSMDALQNMSGGKIALLAARDPAGRVEFSIVDNGPGIKPDVRAKMFVPFFTTRRQGSGVGLTLVRQIARAHGGAVAFCETPGGGATFRLLL